MTQRERCPVAVDSLTLAEASRMMAKAVLDRAYEDTELGPFVQDFLRWKKFSRAAPKTLDQYERDLSRMAITLGHLKPSEVTAPDMLLVLEKFPPGSWRRARAPMNGFWTYMVKNQFVPRNPMDLLPEMSNVPMKIYDIFDAGENARLLKSQDDSAFPQRDRLGVLVFQELGLRKGEASLLTLDNFDMVARCAIVRKAKGGKERAVPFSDELFTALMDFAHTTIPRRRVKVTGGVWVYEDDQPPKSSDFIFFPSGHSATHLLWTQPNKAMSMTSMHRWWHRCVNRSDVKYRSLHMNRHTVGTGLVDADVDAFSVQEWLGHSNVNTTQVYVHNSRSRLRKAADKFRAAKGVRSEE